VNLYKNAIVAEMVITLMQLGSLDGFVLFVYFKKIVKITVIFLKISSFTIHVNYFYGYIKEVSGIIRAEKMQQRKAGKTS